MFPALAVGFFTTSATGGCDLPSPNPVTWEKTLESPLDSKEINPEHSAEAEAPILWSPDAKSWFIGKDPDAGKDRREEEKEATEDEIVGWHHRLNGHEFEQTLEDGEGQGSLTCCSQWGHKELDTTE